MDEANLPSDIEHIGPGPSALVAYTTRCLNCGKSLSGLHVKRMRMRGYCNYECYKAKPPKLAYAEKMFDIPVRELLLEMLNRSTVRAAAELLGVQPKALYKYIKKYNIRKRVIWE